eukprot:gene13349-15376_t
MATYAKLSYNGKVQTVALFEGLDTDELTNLLKTVFSIEGNIVGFMAEKGLVIPISLVSKSPSVVPNSVCKLLVSTSPSKAGSDKLLSTQTNKPVKMADLPTDLPLEDSSAVSEEDSSEMVVAEIKEFVEGLRVRNFLTTQQANLLNALLSSNSTLLFAAYSVAISANDSEYLAEICKDLAQSLVTEQGRSACEAQDEVLQVSDQLYINSRISENQLLYLRHLVLIREEAVATIYDNFQEHQNVPQLAKDLYELCNTHPYQHAQQGTQTAGEKNSQNDDDSGEEDEGGKYFTHGRMPSVHASQVNTVQQSLLAVVNQMHGTTRLSHAEHALLKELVLTENEYVLAAFELYESDQNLEELQDTLLRCAKLETRKRSLEAQEADLEARYRRALQGKYDAAEDAEEGEEDGDDEEEEDEEDEDYEEDEGGKFSLEDIGLSTILESLDVVNIWENSVPAEFVKIVFIAVIRKQLDIYQAKALCDLFHANYDLVRAAWEVHTVQNDVPDMLDTLKRIVKDLTLDEDDDDEGLASSTDGEENEGKDPTYSLPTAAKAVPAAKTSSPAAFAHTPLSAAVKAASPSASQSALDRKKEAMAAVTAAKRDLLKHSLEMMVKQGILKGESANALFVRYQEGDALAEAAIDAYAADRNVAEFLDTLQILASHSSAELNEMMKDVAEEAAHDATSDSPTATNTRANAAIAPADVLFPPAPPVPASVPNTVAMAQLQLKGIVAELARNQMISAEVHAVLNRLVSEPDQRLIVAFQRYLTTQEGAKLIDTLLQVAAAELVVDKKIAESTSRDKQQEARNDRGESPEADSDSNEGDSNASSGNGENKKDSLLNASDQKTVIDILSRANALTPLQTSSLHALVDANNQTVKRIFLAYESDKDVYALIDSLKALRLDPEDGDDEDEESDDDEEQEEEEFDQEDDGTSVETKFLQIVQRMQLSHLETAALRLAIARNDASVREAIEVFRVRKNESSLMAALRAIATETIRNTLSETENQDSNDDDEEEEEENEDEDPDNEAEGYEDDDESRQEGSSDESQDGHQDDEDDEDDSSYERAEAKEVDDLIRKYSTYTSSTTTKSSATSSNDAKQPSPDRYTHQEARSKAASSSSSAYDYKRQEAGEGKYRDESDDEEQDEEEEEEDDEEDEEEEEEEQDQGTSLITSQAARNHVFPILVNELVKESILTSKQGKAVMAQFSEGSSVISAALDIYDRDSDLAHLVNTLQAAVDAR